MYENPRRDRQARFFTTNVPKILDLPNRYFQKLTLGAPVKPARFANLCLIKRRDGLLMHIFLTLLNFHQF